MGLRKWFTREIVYINVKTDTTGNYTDMKTKRKYKYEQQSECFYLFPIQGCNVLDEIM